MEVVLPNGAKLRCIFVPTHRHPGHPVVRAERVIGQRKTKVALATPCVEVHITRTMKKRRCHHSMLLCKSGRDWM